MECVLYVCLSVSMCVCASGLETLRESLDYLAALAALQRLYRYRNYHTVDLRDRNSVRVD